MQHLPATEFCPPAPVFRHDGTSPLPRSLRGATLLLGSFDGFHLGHSALVDQGRRIARRTGSPLAILQLDPHPRAFFGRDRAFRIVSGAAHALLIAREGFDFIHAPRFDGTFAALSPEDFVLNHLVAALDVSAVVAGEDFRFGRNREGDVDLLARLGGMLGFSTDVLPEVAQGGSRVSSSRIRTAIRVGDLATASLLLGRDWTTGIQADGNGWVVDIDQILPPPGTWPVEFCSPLGVALEAGTLHLAADRQLRLEPRLNAAILRWAPVSGPFA